MDTRRHVRELRQVLAQIVVGEAPPRALREFAARQIGRGWPIDCQLLVTPDEVVDPEVRLVVLGDRVLSPYHGHAKAWLEAKNIRPKHIGLVPWNLYCGGIPVGEPIRVHLAVGKGRGRWGARCGAALAEGGDAITDRPREVTCEACRGR